MSGIVFFSLFTHSYKTCLFERDESGRVGGTNTGPSVLHWLVRDAELSKVVADHFRLKHTHKHIGLEL